jgi:beta-lactamase regulating signal transducer with metallopeptidase domain
MSNFMTTTAWVDTLLLELLSFSLRATVLLAGAWLATRLLRQASAATRHLIWTATIAGVLTLPLLSAFGPAWNVPLFTVTAKVPAPVPSLETPAPAVAPDPAAVASTTRPGESLPIVAPATESAAVTPSWTERVAGQLSPRVVVAFAWLLLAALMLSRLAVANLRVSSWQRSSRPVEDGRWLTLVRRLTRAYGIERPVVLLENGETDVPVTWGIVYPVILLPAAADEWDEEQRVAVLTHELAHVKRFDALSQLLAQLALALLWFHPLVWMAVRRMRLEREHACDDFVLIAGARASRYADDLLAFARRLTRPSAPAAAALAMARRSELEGRLLAILDPAMKRTAVRRARVGLLALGVLALAVPLAAFRPAARVTTVATATASMAEAPASVPVPPTVADVPAVRDLGNSQVTTSTTDRATEGQLDVLLRRTGMVSPSMLQRPLVFPGLSRLQADSEPPAPIDLQTLIDVTKATKRMTSDHEKGQMLAMIAKRYQRSDALRDAYLDVVFTMTSDHDRGQALIALLQKDSIPASSTARVLRSTSMMTSDMNRGLVLKRISPATLADTAVQQAWLDVVVSMTSDMERASAISSLLKQRPLAQPLLLALLKATAPMTSNTEKANVLLLFVERQGIADEAVRRAYFKAAEQLTSDYEYRRVIAAVMR